MTNTDEAFRRYCAEFGLCNCVVFDAAYRMGLYDGKRTRSRSRSYFEGGKLVIDQTPDDTDRADLLEIIRSLTLYAERYAETIENEQYRHGVLSIVKRAKEATKEVE